TRRRSPGPDPSPPGFTMAGARRPKRKITARSYSRRIRTEVPITKRTMTTTGTMPKITSMPPIPTSRSAAAAGLPPVAGVNHLQGEPVDSGDAARLPRGRRPVLRDGAPQLAVHLHLALGVERLPHDGGLADHADRAGGRAAVERAHPEGHRHGHE